MGELFSQLIRLYTSAIGFLIALVFALGVMAALAEYLVWLAALMVLLIIARLVWARTSRY